MDLLVNNAGFGTAGRFDRLDAEALHEELRPTGVRTNRAVVVPGVANRAVAGATRLLPGVVVRRAAGMIAARLPG